MGISKFYECIGCHIQFAITVEPDKDEKSIREHFSDSANAIDKGLDECPFCACGLREIIEGD